MNAVCIDLGFPDTVLWLKFSNSPPRLDGLSECTEFECWGAGPNQCSECKNW